MKTKKYLYRIVLFVGVIAMLSFGFFLQGDDPFIASLKNLVSNYDKNVPFEKIYLHIDRPFYKPGDDIWFKVYLTNANNTPSKKSDVVHIELINPKGTVEKSLTLQTIQGICFGDFALDESASGGLYKIKAYTNWMHNFGDDYFFEKDIQVQKVVYSRILSKLDFKRENFAPGDTVKAELSLESLENIPLTFKPVDIDISLDGSKYTSFSATTDNKGKLLWAFHLPTNLKTNDGLVNIKIQHEGNMEAISRSIPIVLNKISMQFFPEGGYMVENIPC
ncbi:MAG TPA: MG2 domain-containing protein, partial [Bacteroidales bacterium]